MWWVMDPRLLAFLAAIAGGIVAYQNRDRLNDKQAATATVSIAVGAMVAYALMSEVILGDKKTDGTLVFIWMFLAPIGAFFAMLSLPAAFMPRKEEAPAKVEPPTPPKPEPIPEPFTIPTQVRLSHMLLLGGTGAGKTTYLKQLIAPDLFKPCSVVVFDSQGDLLNSILKVDFPRERVVLIDPTDVQHPIALSLFDFKTKADTAYDREKNFNSVVELLLFVLQSLDSQVTAKQELTLRMLIRLCLVIPGATIHTLRELLIVEGFKQYESHAAKLNVTAQAFFQNEYLSKSFQETREQITRRIYSILEVESLERMFSSPTSKIDMGKLLDDGSVILVNTAKSFLKEQGSAFFSRFITALIFQAIQERNPQANNTEVFMYIDEAAPVISQQTATILETARKYKLGLTLAFQSLGQVPSDLQHSIISNTAIKAVSGISAKDARALAEDMHTRPDALMAIPRLHFYVYAAGVGSNVEKVEFGALESLPKRRDLEQLYRDNAERYAFTPVTQNKPPPRTDSHINL